MKEGTGFLHYLDFLPYLKLVSICRAEIQIFT